MIKKRGKTILWLAAVLTFVFLSHARAAELGAPGTSEKKLQRGLINTALAPFEISNAFAEAKKREPRKSFVLVPSWLTGGFGGIINMGIRAVTGLYEIVTAPIDWPRNYEPIYRPELVTDSLVPPEVRSA